MRNHDSDVPEDNRRHAQNEAQIAAALRYLVAEALACGLESLAYVIDLAERIASKRARNRRRDLSR
jgi:hypothetical protein